MGRYEVRIAIKEWYDTPEGMDTIFQDTCEALEEEGEELDYGKLYNICLKISKINLNYKNRFNAIIWEYKGGGSINAENAKGTSERFRV